MNFKSYGFYFYFVSLFQYKNWKRLGEADILLIDHDGHRSYDFNGLMYAPLIDSIQDSLKNDNFKILTLAEPYSQITLDRAYGNVLDFNGSFARAAILRVIKLFFKNEKYPGEFGYTKVWNTLLQKIKPKIIIAIMPSEALCYCANKANILIADLQHGVISKTHPWYGESFKKDISKEYLPSHYFCWDQESANVIKTWAMLKKIKVEVVGNPWLVRFLIKDSKDTLVKYALNQSLQSADDKPNILISLGWGNLKYNSTYLSKKYSTKISFEQEAGFSLELLKIIKNTQDKFNWKIRLHPVQMNGLEFEIVNNFLKKIFDGMNNIDWLYTSRAPLPIVLLQTDMHITFTSTITSEAALFGINTALLVPKPMPNDWLDGYFLKERSDGVATLVFNNENSISEWLSRDHTKIKNSILFDQNIYNYNSFIKNIKNLIKVSKN